VDLEKGKKYYMKVDHANYGRSGHYSLAVEIDMTNVASKVVGHHHNFKEIQHLSVASLESYEKSQVTVTTPDSGIYRLQF
jgi:hypothetical protein